MQAGQKIILASNGLDSQQTEELRLSAVSNSNQITLKEPLEFDHSSHSLLVHSLSAEIGLLERSITLTSSSGQGAFVIVKNNATAILQNVACFRCGQVNSRKSSSVREYICLVSNSGESTAPDRV